LAVLYFAEQTLTAMTYMNMLRLYLLPQLEDHQPNVMFQQDGAPPHCARYCQRISWQAFSWALV
jgi:hypothetical protein